MQRVNLHLLPLSCWSQGCPGAFKYNEGLVSRFSLPSKRVYKETGSQLWLKPCALWRHYLAGICDIHQLFD